MSTTTSPQNQQAGPGNSQREERVGAAYAAISKTLKGLSNSETTEVLRALAGANGLQVVFPGTVVQRQSQTTASPKGKQAKAEGKPKAGSVPNPLNKDPKVQAEKELLKKLTSQVKEAAAKNGGPLPQEHKLLLEKKQCEERLRSFRAGEGSFKTK
jgi:hypothetical protein